MYKHVALLVRKAGMTHEEFVDYWQTNHVPIAREIEGVVKYATVLPVTPEAAEFDGLAELYFEDLNALHDALGSEGSRDYDPAKGKAKEARQDVHETPVGSREPIGIYDSDDVDNFLNIHRRPRFIGEVVTQRDDVGGDTDGLYKHSAFLVRKDGMTHEEFVDHWQNNHTPIAREIEGVVKYDTILPTDPENAEFDGVAELYFDDLDALHDALGSEGSRDYDPAKGKAKEAREDVNNFLSIGDRPRFIGKETVQKDETRD
ncbi:MULTISPECIES: EthD domain-containing protein [unclassified Haladaptatus]|uniref:EthD domain-containing protein n=1 Tax=unclassified Haladaptatus TaxID=2622732 RepID=UPI0023E7B57F|nr:MULTISPECIES: EthD domain-containing protein [unclassified Haladaptatus]